MTFGACFVEAVGMSVRAKYTLGIVLLLGVGVAWAINLPKVMRAWRDESPGKPGRVPRAVTRAPVGGQPGRRIDAGELRGTVVTPHLEYPITGEKNVLWCATFQIAWNELCDLLGGPVQSRRTSEMVDILNKKGVTRTDLDETSYVAMAGYPTGGPDDILNRITASMKEKFGPAVRPDLLPKRRSLGRGDWVAYAFLLKELPFEWAFERLRNWNLMFADHRVEGFGIHQFYTRQENEVKAAGQVLVYDYRNPDDFIIEIKTRSQADRLILAKVQSSATLFETVRAVQQRLATTAPQEMKEMSDLVIPVLDFDVVRRYQELSRPGIAIQQIRFKLDETGALLKSEARMAKGSFDEMIFNGPFLVMIQRTGAQVPYFVLWVANAELLVPRGY
jgi:hypothetical protein